MRPRSVVRLASLVVLLASAASLVLPGCAGMRVKSASRELTVIEDIPYRADSKDPKHQLDLYLPPYRGKPFPLVLFVHGGFWRNQDRRYLESITGLYGNVGVALARRGIGVAVTSYRLSPGVGIADQISDVVAALRWVEQNMYARGGDPTRVVLVGYSAGGHLVSMIGLDRTYLAGAGIDSAHVRGIVSISGILDVHAMAAGQDAAFNEEVSHRLFGRTAQEQQRLSPSSFLRADAPPMLALAAQKDYPFVIEAAKSTASRLTAMGARATYREVAGFDHADMVLGINTADDRVSDAVADFVGSVTSPLGGLLDGGFVDGTAFGGFHFMVDGGAPAK